MGGAPPRRTRLDRALRRRQRREMCVGIFGAVRDGAVPPSLAMAWAYMQVWNRIRFEMRCNVMLLSALLGWATAWRLSQPDTSAWWAILLAVASPLLIWRGEAARSVYFRNRRGVSTYRRGDDRLGLVVVLWFLGMWLGWPRTDLSQQARVLWLAVVLFAGWRDWLALYAAPPRLPPRRRWWGMPI